jgi:hypothetical protein
MSRSRIVGLLGIVVVATIALGGCGVQGSTGRVGPRAPFPTSPCGAPIGTPSITLSDSLPSQTVTVVDGSHLVVTVPGTADVKATDVTATNVTFDHTVMRQECSTVLPDRGRRSVLLATRVGKSPLFSTVSPVGDAAMPAWLGTVVVIP